MKLPLVTIPSLSRPMAAPLDVPFVRYNTGSSYPVLLVCDHASAAIPEDYDSLGLPAAALERHIALDIGAARLTEGLAARLQAPAVMAAFSRLFIDPNRGIDEPTLIPENSDGTEVPGNVALDRAERNHRIARYYESYHGAVDAMMAGIAQNDRVPAFLGVHSFTPVMNGAPRPWEVAVLWNRDDRLARYMLDWLTTRTDFSVGANEPYSGTVAGYSMDRHGGAFGYPNAVVEIRQDLLDTEDGVADWTEILARLVTDMVADLSPFAAMPISEFQS